MEGTPLDKSYDPSTLRQNLGPPNFSWLWFALKGSHSQDYKTLWSHDYMGSLSKSKPDIFSYFLFSLFLWLWIRNYIKKYNFCLFIKEYQSNTGKYNDCWNTFNSRTYFIFFILVFSNKTCRFRTQKPKLSTTFCLN